MLHFQLGDLCLEVLPLGLVVALVLDDLGIAIGLDGDNFVLEFLFVVEHVGELLLRHQLVAHLPMLVEQQLILVLLHLLHETTDLVLIILHHSLVRLVRLIDLALVLALHRQQQLIEVGFLFILLVVSCSLQVHQGHLELLEGIHEVLLGLLLLLLQELELAIPQGSVALITRHDFVLLLLQR